MSNYTLDFTLTTDIQRCAAITNICAQATFTSKQYTQMADYILLADDSHTIYPEEFSSPKTLHDIQSLDELMEDPALCDVVENSAQPVHRSIYKKNTRKIDRNNPLHAAVPGMLELWQTIDSIKDKAEENWKTKRLLISLYQQQYILLEAYSPQQPSTTHSSLAPQYYDWYSGVPLQNGTIAHLDLCNPDHMAKFLLFLPTLREYCHSIDCDLSDLIADTDAALAQSNLSPLQQDILNLYHKPLSSTQIISYIKQKYSRTITQAYLSVIFHKQIATKVAEEYAEIYHSRIWANDPSKWRICLSCKQKKLLTTHNFHHFSNKPKGFALICKECTKKKKEDSKK